MNHYKSKKTNESQEAHHCENEGQIAAKWRTDVLHTHIHTHTFPENKITQRRASIFIRVFFSRYLLPYAGRCLQTYDRQSPFFFINIFFP